MNYLEMAEKLAEENKFKKERDLAIDKRRKSEEERKINDCRNLIIENLKQFEGKHGISFQFVEKECFATVWRFDNWEICRMSLWYECGVFKCMITRNSLCDTYEHSESEECMKLVLENFAKRISFII